MKLSDLKSRQDGIIIGGRNIVDPRAINDKNMGRPKAVIDWDQVDELLQAHCDGTAVARLMGVHYNTFYNAVKERYNCEFSEYAQLKRGEGVALVELSIFRDAVKKGGVDRIFWLKNKAGWRDVKDINAIGDLNTTITFKDFSYD